MKSMDTIKLIKKIKFILYMYIIYYINEYRRDGTLAYVAR